MRSLPSFPAVSGAVRGLPLRPAIARTLAFADDDFRPRR